MSNPNKAKGNRWELDLRKLFGVARLGAFKPHQAGRFDAGDIQGLSPFVGQAKDWRDWQAAIREGLDGAEKQKAHAGEPFGVAFVKRARSSAGNGYAVMRVATFARVLLRLRRAEAALAQAWPEIAEHLAAQAEEDLATDFDALAREL